MSQNIFMGRGGYSGKKRLQIPSGAKIYPVHSGRSRLNMPVFKDVCSMFKQLTVVPDDLFGETYKKLLASYSEFVQLIPEHEDMPSHSMLGNSLKRSFAMTQSFIEKMKIREGDRFHETDRGSRWIFAVFSSSLLFRIAKLFVDKQISLCDQKGVFICHWPYYHKSLLAYGKYFKIRHMPAASSDVVSDLSIVLAKQLMPDCGFNWIAEDKNVLIHWFKALNILDEMFSVHQMGLDVEAIMRSVDLYFETKDEHVVVKDQLLGEEYWEWMLEQIDLHKGQWQIDSDGLGVVDGELLFDVDRYIEEFAKVKGVSSDKVKTQLGVSGLVSMQGADFFYKSLQRLGSSGLSSTGLYSGGGNTDMLDAKRFVSVDMSVASAIMNRYKGFEESNEYGILGGKEGIYARIMTSFLGNLIDGHVLDKTGGGIL